MVSASVAVVALLAGCTDDGAAVDVREDAPPSADAAPVGFASLGAGWHDLPAPPLIPDDDLENSVVWADGRLVVNTGEGVYRLAPGDAEWSRLPDPPVDGWLFGGDELVVVGWEAVPDDVVADTVAPFPTPAAASAVWDDDAGEWRSEPIEVPGDPDPNRIAQVEATDRLLTLVDGRVGDSGAQWADAVHSVAASAPDGWPEETGTGDAAVVGDEIYVAAISEYAEPDVVGFVGAYDESTTSWRAVTALPNEVVTDVVCPAQLAAAGPHVVVGSTCASSGLFELVDDEWVEIENRFATGGPDDESWGRGLVSTPGGIVVTDWSGSGGTEGAVEFRVWVPDDLAGDGTAPPSVAPSPSASSDTTVPETTTSSSLVAAPTVTLPSTVCEPVSPDGTDPIGQELPLAREMLDLENEMLAAATSGADPSALARRFLERSRDPAVRAEVEALRAGAEVICTGGLPTWLRRFVQHVAMSAAGPAPSYCDLLGGLFTEDSLVALDTAGLEALRSVAPTEHRRLYELLIEWPVDEIGDGTPSALSSAEHNEAWSSLGGLGAYGVGQCGLGGFLVTSQYAGFRLSTF